MVRAYLDIIKVTFGQISAEKYALPLTGRGVILGGVGGTMEPPDFGKSVHPFSTRGLYYANQTTTGTPGFSGLPTALLTSRK